MSFQELRAARHTKPSRSFVKPTSDSAVPEASAAVTADVGRAPVAESSQSTSRTTEIIDSTNYRSFPPTLEVRKSNENGRGIYAKQGYTPGSVLMSVKPHISALSTLCLDAYCSSCCGPAPSSGLKRCTRCRTVWYCSTECQNKDWRVHKRECAALQKWAAAAPSPEVAIPSDAIRCLGRLLWEEERRGIDSDWTKEINTMQSHRSSMPLAAVESHTHLAHSVVRYLGITSPVELGAFGLTSAGDLVDLVSRFTTNTFTLTSPSLAPIGVCICPVIALINHSCEPNAVIVFPGTSDRPSVGGSLLQLIAIRDINPGEEILTAYVDTTLPRELRQKDLQDTYNFKCQCTLCSRSSNVDPRESLWCPKSCGGTCPLPTDEHPFSCCVNCNAAVPAIDSVLDAVRIGQEALHKIVSLQFKDPGKAKHIASNMLPILISANLTPSSHPILALTHLHLELLINSLPESLTQETLDETIRTAARYVSGLSAIHPPGHPVRGVALAELGKLLAVDEPSPAKTAEERFPPSGPKRLRMAYETFVQARNELMIGFGKANGGGMVGKEVREAVVRLEKELGAWTQGVRNALEDGAVTRIKQTE